MFTIQFGDLKSHLLAALIILILFIFNRKFSLQKFDFWYLGFLGCFIVSTIFSETPYGFKEFSTFFAGFGVYLLAKNFSIQQAKSLAIPFIVLVGILSAGSVTKFLISPVDRLDGFFIGYPNVMATWLLLVIPLLVYLYFQYSFQEERFKKIATTFSLVFSVTAFILTFARGPLLAAFVMIGLGLGIYAIFKANLKKFIAKLFLFSFFVFAATGLSYLIQETKIYSLDVSDRLISSDISSAKSVNERLIFFENSAKIFMDSPKNILLGIGPGSFQLVHPKWQTESFTNSEHPHNLFIKIFLELGLFAGLFFLAWLFSILISIFKTLIESPTKNKLSLTLGVSLVGFFIASLVDYNLGFVPVYILVFGYLGYLVKDSSGSKFVLNTILKNSLVTILLLLFLCQGLFFYEVETRRSYPPVLLEYVPYKQDVDLLNHDLYVIEYINENYPNLYTVKYRLFEKTQYLDQKIAFLQQAIELNPYNNFEYFLDLFENASPEISQKYFNHVSKILQRYNGLLAINAHFTVISDTPFFANELYKLLPKSPELEKQYQEFQTILFAEAVKFDTRYQTELLNKFKSWNYNY
jgi:O-antigen ligase